MNRTVFSHALTAVLLAAPAAWAQTPLYGVFETSVTNGNAYANPFADVTLNATFTHRDSGRQVQFIGFHDGDGNGGQNGAVWKQRFMPDQTGTWDYVLTFSDGTAGGTGSFDCVAAGAKPGPVRAAGSHLRYADGTDVLARCYYLAEALTGGAFENGPLAGKTWQQGVDHFFGGQYDYNMACTLLWQGPAREANGWNGMTFNGFYPIVGEDYKRLSVANWKHAEEVVGYLASKNVLWYDFDGFVPNWGSGMTDAQRKDFEAQKVFARNVVARMAPYWNVVWNMCFEWHEIWGDGQEVKVAQLTDYVKGLDPWDHLSTVHDQLASTSAADYLQQMHGDLVTLQYAAGTCGDALVANQLVGTWRSGNTPVFAQEVSWEGSQKLTADQVRKGAWGAALAGGILCYAEMFEAAAGQQDFVYGDGAALPYLEVLNDLLASLPHQQMDPHNEKVNAGTLCLADLGDTYLCYRQDGGGMTLDLTGLAGEFQVTWIDPRTGQTAAGGMLEGGAVRGLGVAPYGGDVAAMVAVPKPATMGLLGGGAAGPAGGKGQAVKAVATTSPAAT
jgi:hypothetical protein